MGSIAIAGDTSGSITITVPAVAGNNTLILPATSATIDIFPVGTAMMFAQTAAPTGWTKSTANDNAALRVVSGTVGTGGSVNFTSAFASQAVAGSVSTSISAISGTVGTSGATTLSTAQMPTHNHGTNAVGTTGGVGIWFGSDNGGFVAASINNTGSSNSHTHTGGAFTFSSGTASSSFTGTAINLAVKYVDVIVATKN
jgi:hypothetical protein